MTPCTPHTLEIIPVANDDVFTAKKVDFTTTNGTPQKPSGFTLNEMESNPKGGAQLSWEGAQCATGYYVYFKAASEEEPTKTELLSDLQFSKDDLSPCEEYAFAVATAVNGDESEPTDYVNLQIRPDLSVVPTIEIVSPEGDNVTVKVQPAEPNQNCEVSMYEVRYAAKGGDKADMKTVTPTPGSGSIGEDIRLPVQDQNAYITAKLMYAIKPKNGDGWTKPASIGNPGISDPKELVGDSTSGLLIPVVVAVAVLAVIVIVVTVLVLRRKRTMRGSFDAEKGSKGAENGKAAENGAKASTLNANDDETQKLNTENPDNFA